MGRCCLAMQRLFLTLEGSRYFNKTLDMLVEFVQLFGGHPQLIVVRIAYVLHRKLL